MIILEIIDEITAEFLTPGKCNINDMKFEVFKFNDAYILTTVVLHEKQLYLSNKSVNPDSKWTEFRDITDDYGYKQFLNFIGRK